MIVEGRAQVGITPRALLDNDAKLLFFLNQLHFAGEGMRIAANAFAACMHVRRAALKDVEAVRAMLSSVGKSHFRVRVTDRRRSQSAGQNGLQKFFCGTRKKLRKTALRAALQSRETRFLRFAD